MNPFTKYLSQWSRDPDFDAFVRQWDRLEQIVIGVYRGKVSADTARPEYDEVWPQLRQLYPRWENELEPYWQATRAAGEPTRVDPFGLLLDIPAPSAIPGDWRAMQHLPAAREAINHYLTTQDRSTTHQ